MVSKRIMVAFDGSKPSEKAFHYALATAKQNNALLWVVSVVQLPEPATMVETDAILDSAKENYELLFQPLREEAKSSGVALEMEIAVGHPAEQIIRKAKDLNVDLVVVGHRGHSRIEEWLLGSVSKRVSSYAPCAVTIVR
jgi:nucleotide-binding universal stress UspA family protein